MKILVTGGAGFIGSNFIRHMLAKYPGYKLVNLDKLTYAGNLDNLKDIENNRNYKLFDGIDVVVNFAAETHVDRSILGADSFVETNILGTYNLLETARETKLKRFVHISTDEVYGSISRGKSKESGALSPNNPYSASKSSADLIARSYFVTYKIPVIITRSSNNYGPYQYPEKVIPLFCTNALDDKPLPLYGSGINVRDWLFVEDNCRAIDLVLHKGVEGEIYNIGGGNELANIELTQEILKILGKPKTLIQRVADRRGHDLRYSVDCSKIKNELGWEPVTDFNSGLKSTITWYEENRSWWEKIKNRTFKEYYKKQYKDVR
jgi:dTDP-glucose 4,6-dehydratase